MATDYPATPQPATSQPATSQLTALDPATTSTSGVASMTESQGTQTPLIVKTSATTMTASSTESQGQAEVVEVWLDIPVTAFNESAFIEAVMSVVDSSVVAAVEVVSVCAASACPDGRCPAVCTPVNDATTRRDAAPLAGELAVVLAQAVPAPGHSEAAAMQHMLNRLQGDAGKSDSIMDAKGVPVLRVQQSSASAPTDGGDDSNTSLIIIIAASCGGVALLAGVAGMLLMRRRARSQMPTMEEVLEDVPDEDIEVMLHQRLL
eukprot:TRINITY_DN312_c0_g4_i1.p1 TRINITY_DN312_c0_g4~~TRINITY_DN312_c0_g4_i1.p1  ORF type:complete len:293 (+),score=22.78 TRINITY_DN312_c0_g4_i1:92-880(+)